MMNIESKMSGWKVTNFETKPIFDNEIISLADCVAKIHKQESMDFILDTFRFSKGQKEGTWFAVIDWDTIMKISILETNEQEAAQFKEIFGKDWYKRYLRFNH